MTMYDIPYSRFRAIRIYTLTGIDCGQWGLRWAHDYGIPRLTLMCGRWGYAQVFWCARRRPQPSKNTLTSRGRRA
jgi:hypothetical protein